MKKIAIVIAMNDLTIFQGGSLNGIKSKISYFDQFLILYESIIENWKKVNFDYEIYLLHSIPFSSEKTKILKNLNIDVVKVSYEQHETKIRPMCYKINIDCDFRLVMDVDIFALKEPVFNFNYDVQAMYGGNKYNKSQWRKITKYLGCEMPKFRTRYFSKGTYNSWSFREHYLYHMDKINEKRFPFFNNGVILIKNDICDLFVEKWENYRELYTEFIHKEFNIDIGLEGQDVIGLAIHNTTINWTLFQKGINFINQEYFDLGKQLLKNYKGEIYLLHYINMTENSRFYDLIFDKYSEILKKYYN